MTSTLLDGQCVPGRGRQQGRDCGPAPEGSQHRVRSTVTKEYLHDPQLTVRPCMTDSTIQAMWALCDEDGYLV